MARARANPAFNTDVPWAALRAGPRAGGQLCVEGQLQGGEFVPIDDCNGSGSDGQACEFDAE